MDTIDQVATAAQPDKNKSQPSKPVRKRRYSVGLKRQMVEATLTGDESVSVVARRYDVNANQLFKWRRLYRQGLLGDATTLSALVPINVDQANQISPSDTHDNATHSGTASLEIYVAGGHRLVVTGTVCPTVLETALTVLSG